MTHPVRPLGRGVAVLVAAALAATSCGSDGGPGSPDDRALVATTAVWADIVGEVLCADAADVTPLIPAGTDPHAFEPSLTDRARLDAAALVVANGLGLEEGLEDTLDASEAAGTEVVRAADLIDPLPASGDHDGHDDDGDDGDDEHHDDSGDPHIWLDPIRVAATLDALGREVTQALELPPDDVERCVEDYRAELETLDVEIAALLEPVPSTRRKLVTNHDALAYFADRYGFEVIGTVIPSASTLAEPNPAHLEELAQLIQASDVSAIFTSAEESTDDIDALARRLDGVDVVVLDVTNVGSGSAAGDYPQLMRTLARSIADALS